MTDIAQSALLPRPNVYRQPDASDAKTGDISKALPLWERLRSNTMFRRGCILVLLAAVWQGYATYLQNDLLLPSFWASLTALYDAFVHGPLLWRMLYSIQVLLTGYIIGAVLAGVLVSFAVSTKWGSDLLATLTAMLNPLPAIALLPLALLWFGLGMSSMVFVIVHSVLWAVALNAQTGFQSVSETLRMAGQNFGLRNMRYIFGILVPAAFPSILNGLKIGWAFAWRTLIAAELVFGATSRSGGIGWFIFENRNSLETANVFAGLLTVIVIGLLVDGLIFRAIERRTVRRWGMQR
ncbi:ABC transporter permease [Rhodopseudomonas sp. B29]|uniref:ABC transporter permease n=1 Tax=Rhodopseudomonas sp. B29 TaxID=95607 RepID=UPI00034A119F|nr:ABC transporter permease [Rhodopseudomonas sp. B29]